MPWNEMSGRYVVFNPEFYKFTEFRKKANDKKQGSGGPIEDDHGLEFLFEKNDQECFRNYTAALAKGLCEEQARSLLPLNLLTQWYWSGTIGAWSDMYNLRIKPDTQRETQEIARQIGDIIQPLYPVSWSALTGETT